VVGAAIVVGDRCLIGRRLEQGSFGGLWEFPGGKVEPGEHPMLALRREVREELGIEVEVGPFLARGQAQTTRRLIRLDVYLAEPRDPAAPIECRDHLDLRFVRAEDMDFFPWAPADIPIIVHVQAHLRGRQPFTLPPIVFPQEAKPHD
jgi:8-oxo-dGTP diphosphatase